MNVRLSINDAGIDKAKLSELAAGAEKGCPISNAIRGTVNITVDAQAT